MTFGPDKAECSDCEFNTRCNGPTALHARGHRPKNWQPGGLMMVLETPSAREVALKAPTGADIDFLRSVCASVGVDFDSVWVTYAVLAQPVGLAKGAKNGGVLKQFPGAVPGCLPRLEAEIAAARPRVVMPLGNVAMAALVGEETRKMRRVAFTCRACDPKDRKVGPVFQCAVADCSWAAWPPAEVVSQAGGLVAREARLKAWGAEVIEACGGVCPACSANVKRLKPKRVKCPTCGGKKMREEERVTFKSEYALTGRDGVAGAILLPEEQQSRLDDFGVKYIIPSYTPWFCRMPTPKRSSEFMVGGQFSARVLAEHIRKAASLLHRDADAPAGYITTAGKTPLEAAEMIRAYTAEEHGTYALDIETNSYDGPWAEGIGITCVGLSRLDRAESLVIDTRDCGMDLNPGHPVVEALADFCFSARNKVLVNRPYDEVVMRRVWDIELGGEVHDAMVAHYCCYPDEEHGLGFMAHELTDAPAWKGGSHKIPKGKRDALSGYQSFDDLARYNGKDTHHTCEVDVVLRGADGRHGGRLDEEGVRQVYETDMKMQKIALEMQMWGMPVGLAELDALRKQAEDHIEHHLKAMREFLGNPVTIDEKTGEIFEFVPRGDALLDVLFNPEGRLRLPVVKEGASGKPSAEAGVLLKHIDKPFVQHLLAWRKHDYALSHYITSPNIQPHPSDGRWHPIWKTHVARTGRWTSEPNFQNWPKYIRTACVAPPGRKLVGYDYDQLELRGIAWVSGDERLISMVLNADGSDKLNPDCDLHSFIASVAFGRIFTDLDRHDPTHREVAAGEESCACQKCQRKALREVAKCVHPDTLVNLDGSYTTLGAYVGAMPAGAQGRVQYDSIADGRGSWTGVEAYYRPGAKACVHVTTQRGVLTCAEDHPLATATGGTVLAKDALGVELASCEVAALPYVGPMPQVVVPGGAFRSLPTMHIHTNHTWAYFAGMFLGDGTVTGTTMAICHGDVRTEDAAHGTSYLAWQDQIVAVLEALGFVATRRNTMVTFGDRQAGRCLAALGLTTHDMRVGTAAAPPKGQRRLRVPPWVLAMGREGVEHFLAGLADTDGSVGSSGALRITTKDPVFAGQLATLFQALGESRVRMEPMWNKTYERYYWRLGPTVAFGHRVLFDKMRHPKRLRLRAGSLTPRTKTTNKCTAVVPAGELECVDIQVSADDHMYQQNNFIASNTVIYAVNYGSGAETVHENIYNKGYEGPPITVAMVQDVMVAIFSEFPGLVRYREETLRQARETGELRSPLLFRHRIFPLGDIEATVAYNYPIQSLGADIVNTRLAVLYDELRVAYPTAWIVAQVHDAVYVECDEADAEGVARLVERCMNTELKLPGSDIIIPFTGAADIGQSWDQV